MSITPATQKFYDKRIVILLGAISLGVLVVWLISTRQPYVVPPYKVAPDALLPKVTLVSTTPKDGLVSTLDPFYMLRFDFSGDLDIAKVSAVVTPELDTYLGTADDSKAILFLIPKSGGWKPNVVYTISLESPQFTKSITYIYKNTPPVVSETTFPF